MNRKYVVENNVVERYLLEKLSPEERDEFEQFYLDDQETLDELELQKRLLAGFRKMRSDDEDAN